MNTAGSGIRNIEGKMRRRLSTPRIKPLEFSAWDETARAVIDAPELVDFGDSHRPIPNVYKTQANHSALFKATRSCGEHVYRSTLTPRQRELLILRTSWKSEAEYAWHRHVEIGIENAGLTMTDIDRVKEGPSAEGWTNEESALLEAVDELISEQFISDPTWAQLAATLKVQQLMDVVYTVGNYTTTCMALNSFGVQLEPGYDKYRK